MNTPQPPENVESVIDEKIAKKMQKFQEAVQRFYKGEVTSRYLDDIFNDFLFSTYADGRADLIKEMKKELSKGHVSSPRFELLGLALENKTESTGTSPIGGSKIKIVVLQRGWVVIGEYSENRDECVLENASVIRRWGTSEGLGELALKGKQSETVLDKTGTVRFNKLTSVAFIDCDEKIWKGQL